MSNFERQAKRASQKQEKDVLMDTVKAIHEEQKQLTLENKSLYRTIGALTAVAGGEVRIPRDLDAVLKGKKLKTELDEETNEFIFRIVPDIEIPKAEIIIP